MESETVKLFLGSIRSEVTKNCFSIYLNKWMHFIEDSDIDEKNPRVIESKLIEFLLGMKNKGMSYGAIRNYFTAITSYYKINDIVLNTTKLSKFLPENKKVKRDRAYTHQEISKLLEISDERMRVAILLFSSSGIRLGATTNLKLKHLDMNSRKLTVYENDKEEYFTFVSPECKDAIDSYLDMRSRYGEKLNDESLLIREQFDVRSIANPRPRIIQRQALQRKLYDLCQRAGIKKGEISIAHGFRKFFTTQLINSKINPEIREMLLGHKIGLTSCYYRPTQEEMYVEYQKAVNSLTINEENRLKIKLELLEGDNNEIQDLKKQVNDNNSMLNDVISLLKLKMLNQDTIGGTKEHKEQRDTINEIDSRLLKKGIRVGSYSDKELQDSMK